MIREANEMYRNQRPLIAQTINGSPFFLDSESRRQFFLFSRITLLLADFIHKWSMKRAKNFSQIIDENKQR